MGLSHSWVCHSRELILVTSGYRSISGLISQVLWDALLGWFWRCYMRLKRFESFRKLISLSIEKSLLSANISLSVGLVKYLLR